MAIRILKITDPPIKGDPDYAYPLSVLLNEKKAKEWFYCNFIQICFSTYNKGCYINYFYTDVNNKRFNVRNPLLNYQAINKDVLKTLSVNIIDFIIKMLDLGYYFYTYFDEYYMKFSIVYNKIHMQHVSFLYGYDSDKKLFYIAGYDKTMHYNYYTAGFDEVARAYDLCERDYWIDHNTIYLLNYKNQDREYNFDINAVLEQLREYLNSTDSSEKFNVCFNKNTDFVYGINAVESVKNKLNENIADPKVDFPFKTFYILWEHKGLMESRIKYIIEKGFLNSDCLSVGLFAKLETGYKKLLDMAIKYFIVLNTDILKKMQRDMTGLIESEHKAFGTLIEEIEKGRKA